MFCWVILVFFLCFGHVSTWDLDSGLPLPDSALFLKTPLVKQLWCNNFGIFTKKCSIYVNCAVGVVLLIFI